MTSKPIFICHRKVRCWNTFSSLEVQVSNQVWLQEWMWVLLSRTYPEEGKMRWKEIYGGEGNAQFPYLAFIHFSFLLGSVYTHTPPPPPPPHIHIHKFVEKEISISSLWRKEDVAKVLWCNKDHMKDTGNIMRSGVLLKCLPTWNALDLSQCFPYYTPTHSMGC